MWIMSKKLGKRWRDVGKSLMGSNTRHLIMHIGHRMRLFGTYFSSLIPGIYTVRKAEWADRLRFGSFADGWKIFLFEAQNVIRTNLEQRYNNLQIQRGTAHISDANLSQHSSPGADLMNIAHLVDIARSKCEVKTRQIMDIVRAHVGTRLVLFLRWNECTFSFLRKKSFRVLMHKILGSLSGMLV